MAEKNLSKLQENFTCLAIACVDLIKQLLIDVLDNHIKPSDLYANIKSSTLISGNELRPDQKKLCYITPGTPDYSKFDVSLLYTLIRNLCPSLKPTGKWGVEPAASHTQLGDDIERLRLFRNRKFAHAKSAETPDNEFQNHWTYLQTVIYRIQSNKKAGCKTDYVQSLKCIEKRLLDCKDLDTYKLLLEATLHVSKLSGDIDGPDIWIKGTEEVVCGSTAHFEAIVKEKKVSHLSVIWLKKSQDKSAQIFKCNKKFWGKTNKELFIEYVCKEDEGEYQALLSIEEDRTRKTIQSNVIYLHVVGGIPTVITSHETRLQTHSVKLIGNVFVIDDLPVLDEIYWSKDGNKINTHGNEGKYSKVSVDVPSLTIYNVNQYDAGHYTLTATNAAGTTVSDAIVLGAPDIVLDESKEESDGSQIFTVTITSVPAAYSIQWQVSDKTSDMFTTLDENAEEYKGTSHVPPHPVLVVKQKEQLKNNIYQIEVQNFVGGRRKKIPSILNMFYKDRGAGVMFAKLFNEIAEMFPERKLNRLQDLILDSCKDKDIELSTLIKNANSAREYFRILKEKELFTPSDVIFMQFLLRESNCGVLNEKCIAYAKTQKALCFYEEPPRNGYKKVQFHVQGNISNYTAEQIGLIRETVAAIVGCDSEEIDLNGLCNSTSFFVDLSMKERYVDSLLNMKQQDKEKLILLNIDYFIVDLNFEYLKNPKAEENEESYEKIKTIQIERKLCIHCSNDNYEVEATHFCKTCEDPEPLCEMCAKQHQNICEYPVNSNIIDYKMIAAIDFGTTYSGFAFGMVGDLDNDPMKIHANHAWVSGHKNLLSLKVPTCLLLDENKQFQSFGYEAENQYNNIMMNRETENYYYFYRFKMNLHENKESFETMELKEAGGKTLPAISVFTLSIKALKDHLLETLDTSGITLQDEEVLWVLTVPAIWTDSAKFFMRKAALEAGISDDRLILALEPEAACIYCQHIHTDQSTDQRGFEVSAVGTRYMVIDLGGGTADMTVHEKLSTGLLKELFKGSGGACGGTAVESKVLDVFEEIVGNEVFSEFKWKYVERYMDLLREIDVFKRNIKPESDVKIKLAIPLMCLDEICLKMRNKHFKDLLAKSSMSKHIFLTGDKLRFSADFARQLFTSITDQIVEYIRVILQHPEVESVNRFLLVGGFSESPMVQHAIKTHFPGKQLIIPQDAVLAVVKGAVLFGHRPTSIKSRIIKYSYGVKTLPVFDPMVHDIKKRFFIDGEDRCKDVFSSFMRSGTPAEINLEVEKKYQTYRPFQKTVSLDVFYTVDENPKYIDEKRVRKLGNLDVTIPYPSKNPRIVKVIYVFGDTELKVKAVDMETGMPCEIIIT